MLQKYILDQLHTNHMGIEMTQVLARESVYWINMNADKEQCAMHLEYQQTKPQEKALCYKIPCTLWETVDAHIHD